MRKTCINAAVAAALLAGMSGVVMAEDSPISANVSIVSDYQYRGWSQTDEKMALQGGFDYAHDSGFYIGAWGSSVSWLSDATDGVSNSLELDVYGGYSTELGPIGLDVGLLQYYYPGSYPSRDYNSPNTLEGYVGVSWEFLTFKYSYAFTDLFGAEDSDGSQYFDLGAEYEVGAGFTVAAHVGRQKIENGTSYNDWKVGVSKEFVGLTFGLDYVDTDVDNEDLADGRVILSVSKSF